MRSRRRDIPSSSADQREAEAALIASNPAVVLSDLRLTEGDGFGVLRASRARSSTPVIVMTAFGSIRRRGRHEGRRADFLASRSIRIICC
jgi:DNA-binding NtrC family response regulator